MKEMSTKQLSEFTKILKEENLKFKRKHEKKGKIYYVCVDEKGEEKELTIMWAGDMVMMYSF